MPVVLDVRTFGPGEAHLAEDRGDLVHHLADRMQRAVTFRPHRQGDIDLLGDEPGGERGGAEHRLARLERGLDLALELVDPRAELLALLGGERAQRLHQAGDAALLAEGRHAHGLERAEIGRLLDGAERLVTNRRKIFHRQLQTKRGSLWPGSLLDFNSGRLGGARTT